MNEQLNEYYDNLYEEVTESSILENVEQYDEMLDFINYTETNLIKELMKHMDFDAAQELIDQYLSAIEEYHHLQNRMMVKYALYDGAGMHKLVKKFEDYEEVQNARKG